MHVLGMPPAFVLSQDQTLRLTRTIHRPGSSPSRQTIQANEGSSPNALSSGNPQSRTNAPGLHTKRRSRHRRKPNQEHVRRGNRLLTRCRRPRIPSYRPTMSNSEAERHVRPTKGYPPPIRPRATANYSDVRAVLQVTEDTRHRRPRGPQTKQPASPPASSRALI